MTGPELCDFCRGLVFPKVKKYGLLHVEHLRQMREIQESVDCPFCNTFKASLLAEDPVVEGNALCVYEVRTWQDAFIELTMTMYNFTDADGDLDSTVATWNRNAKESIPTKKLHWMIAHAEDGEPEAWERFQKRADWQPFIIMDINTRFDSVVRWLDTCVNQREGIHTNCFDSKIPGFPSRLLDLEDSETSGHIRLIESADLPKPLPEYTTLSHCWGRPGDPRPPRTTAENLRAHKRRILLLDLPKTFRDAITITHRIGRSFLWIDSLAIVQDDTEEWEREAAQMAGIYANSFLTIAATDSTHCEGGCGLEPWISDVTEATARSPDGPLQSRGGEHCIRPYAQYQLKLKRTTPFLKYEAVTAPLHTRGWVLQELFLSPRVVHMTHRHMLWQCRVHFDQEDANPRFSDQVRMWHESNGSNLLWNRFRIHYDVPWWRMVEKYTSMKFTHVSDRLPAMAGIVQYHGIQQNDTSLLGLWKKSLPYDLSWYCTRPETCRFPGIPTWSWLSSRGNVFRPPNIIPKSPMASYDDASCIEWRRQSYVSKLEIAVLVVRTKVFHTILDSASTLADAVRDNFKKEFLHAFPDSRDSSLGSKATPRIILRYYNDITMAGETCDGVAMTYMLLYTAVCGEGNPDCGAKGEWIVFLTLRATSEEPSSYIRVGYGLVNLSPFGTTVRLSEWPRPGLIKRVLKDWKDATVKLL